MADPVVVTSAGAVRGAAAPNGRLVFRGTSPERYRLAGIMSRAWAAFAHSGNPNHDDLPVWPRYDPELRATMLFDVSCRVEDDPRREERLAWEGMALRR